MCMIVFVLILLYGSAFITYAECKVSSLYKKICM